MARSASNLTQGSADIPAQRCVAALAEVLEDIRGQVYSTNPQLAQLVQIAEHLASVTILHPDELRDVLEELRVYEQQHLDGRERYTRILREARPEGSQLRWDW